MKKTLTTLALITMLSLLPGSNGIFAQDPYPLDFHAYAYNPVLTRGNPGSYDADLLLGAYAFWYDGYVYLWYTGNAGICYAWSFDGYEFHKGMENPIFTPSPGGFDSYQVSGPVFLETTTEWVMYYCAREDPGWGPGQFIGRATSGSLIGPWERSPDPVLAVGSAGEWDMGFITPHNVCPLDTGGFIMFYSASDDIATGLYKIGMATSPDGIIWTKYNDPNTPFPPYEESDPVLWTGDPGEWDDAMAAYGTVIKKSDHYEIYYTGSQNGVEGEIGFASSTDGITWQKWPGNPVYIPADDPYAVSINSLFFELPSLLVYNDVVFIYYDYGIFENSIGMATADVWTRAGENRITNDDFRMTIYPNPVCQFTMFAYTLKESGQVILEIFDSFGRMVYEPVNAYQQKGEKQVIWNAENLPSGIYFYRLRAGNKEGNGKIIKL